VLLAFGDNAAAQAVLPAAKFTERSLAEVRRGWARRGRTGTGGGQCLRTGPRPQRCGDRRGLGLGPIDRMGRRPGARWAADLLAASEALTRRL
jgi:hypothetical protein